MSKQSDPIDAALANQMPFPILNLLKSLVVNVECAHQIGLAQYVELRPKDILSSRWWEGSVFYPKVFSTKVNVSSFCFWSDEMRPYERERERIQLFDTEREKY